MQRFALCLILLTGCSFDLDLDGDETPGEEGRSSWQMDDGLCPGFGGCGLDVPLAAGASTVLDIEVPDRDPLGIEVVAEGPITVDSVVDRDVENERLRVAVTATGAGEAILSLREDGEELDRARLTVAQPAGMTCGVEPDEGGVRYTLAGFDLEAEGLTLVLPTDGSSARSRDLACRLEDADGTPLLSVRLIEWEVTDGAEAVRIYAEPFAPDAPSARGARVTVHPRDVGVARVVARYGELERAFTVTVE